MKMMKTVMAGAVAMALVSFGVNAAGQATGSALPVNQGSGVINFKGTVIDAPCGIAPESADQTIDFGQVSNNQLKKGGTSKVQPLNIKLVNCDITGSQKKSVSMTFSGTTVDTANNELGAAGDTGVAVIVASADGKKVTFDGATPSSATKLKDGDNVLQYSTWVQKASTATDIKEGEFFAVANFNMNYQ